MTKRDQVLNYIKNQRRKFLLKFCEDNGVNANIEINFSDNADLVVKVLMNMKDYYSINSKGIIETCRGGWRSSLDIWRHCKFYNKDITIFEVMNILYKINDRLAGQFCSDVNRRVFTLSECPYGLLFDKQRLDEYSLIFKDWEDI